MIAGLFVTFGLIGAVSLAAVLATLLGLVDPLFKKVARSRLETLETSASPMDSMGANWPLPARLARSFGMLTGRTSSDEDLMVRLLRAGLPYRSPAHYYSRQVTNALLFAAFGLVNASAVGLLLDLPIVVILGAALGLGLWGAGQPAAEVRARILKRSKAMTVDMTYQLPRLILLLDAFGTIQEAISGYLSTAERANLSEAERREMEEGRDQYTSYLAMQLGITLRGMGGNLFAELLQAISVELTRSVRPETIAGHMRLAYPPGVELNNFLDILTAGLSGGMPMKERLVELSHQLRIDLRARQREMTQAANQVVILAAAAELLPIFFVVGAPVLFMAFQMFR